MDGYIKFKNMKNKLLLIIFYFIALYVGAQNNPQWIEPLYLSHGADIASASTLTLGSDGNSFDVTGTTQIDSISSFGVVGSIVTLQFDGALTLVHSADIVLPGGANVTTAAGDVFVIEEYATGQWRCVSYALASGEAILGGVTINGTTNNGITTYNSGTGNLDVESNATYASNIFDIQIGNTTSDTYQLIRRTDNSQQILSGVNNDFQEGFTEAATVTGQSNSSTLPFILGGRSNVDTGTTPITAFNSAYTGGTLTTRPAFGFYSEGSLLIEVAANGNLNHQSNEILGIADGGTFSMDLRDAGLNDLGLFTDTSDGSDNGSIKIGHTGATRGSYLQTRGNEADGDLVLSTGDATSAEMQFAYGGTVAMTLDDAGDFAYSGSPSLTGIGQLNVDNLRSDGNTLSSTNTNGDISLDPNGTGNTNIVSGALEIAGTEVISSSRAGSFTTGSFSDGSALPLIINRNASSGKGIDFRESGVSTSQFFGAAGGGFTFRNTTGVSANDIVFSSGGDIVMTGDIAATGSRVNHLYTVDQTTTNAETVDSDERLKKNIDTLSNATGKINQLRAVKYHWKDSVGRGNGKHFGFVAQEVEEVFPEIVTTSIDSLGNETKGIRYTELIPFLIRAVQEQQVKINELEAKIEELENQ